MNTTADMNVGEVCFANIGPKEWQKRLIGGGVSLALGLAVFVALRAFGAPLWMNIVTLPFFFGAATGFFQWKDKTCLGNVRRGVTNMDSGDVTVTDELMKAALNAQARKVQIKSLLAGLGATALCVFLSVL